MLEHSYGPMLEPQEGRYTRDSLSWSRKVLWQVVFAMSSVFYEAPRNKDIKGGKKVSSPQLEFLSPMFPKEHLGQLSLNFPQYNLLSCRNREANLCHVRDHLTTDLRVGVITRSLDTNKIGPALSDARLISLDENKLSKSQDGSHSALRPA